MTGVAVEKLDISEIRENLGDRIMSNRTEKVVFRAS
jgi:hypothetical protein